MPPLSDSLRPDRSKDLKEIKIDEMTIRLAEFIKNNAINKKQLTNILTDGSNTKQRRKLNDMVNAPYYREPFALQFKFVLDQMIQEFASGVCEDRIFRYEEFQCRPNTLYLRVSQSRKYLLDNLDPEKVYARFCEKLSVTKEHGIGVRLSYIREIGPEGFMPDKVMPLADQASTYKDKIDEFLENAKKGDTLDIKRLALSEEDIRTLELSLAHLENIAYKISATTIFLVKTI